MLAQIPGDITVYLACGYTDMRKQIDGLAALVQTQFHMDCNQRALFLFCGRRSDRLKGLLWEGDGFLLFYKRLENGRFQWPQSQEAVRELSRQEYRWLLEGLTLDPQKRIRPSERKALV